MKKLLIIPVLVLLVITMPIAFADEDEYEDEYEDDDREGFGVMEREREREHDGDEGIAIGSSTGNIILYVTIGAIGASVAYTGIKVFKTKRRVVSRA